MSYEKQTWTTGEVITEEKLNHMEDGIADESFDWQGKSDDGSMYCSGVISNKAAVLKLSGVKYGSKYLIPADFLPDKPPIYIPFVYTESGTMKTSNFIVSIAAKSDAAEVSFTYMGYPSPDANTQLFGGVAVYKTK